MTEKIITGCAVCDSGFIGLHKHRETFIDAQSSEELDLQIQEWKDCQAQKKSDEDES